MSVHDPVIYDLADLTRKIAEEVMGETYFYFYQDFGTVEGYQDHLYTVRPGSEFNTDHRVFLELHGVFISVDQYGDVLFYAQKPYINRHLACIIADAKRAIIAEQEPRYVESIDYIEQPDYSVRMAI